MLNVVVFEAEASQATLLLLSHCQVTYFLSDVHASHRAYNFPAMRGHTSDQEDNHSRMSKGVRDADHTIQAENHKVISITSYFLAARATK